MGVNGISPILVQYMCRDYVCVTHPHMPHVNGLVR